MFDRNDWSRPRRQQRVKTAACDVVTRRVLLLAPKKARDAPSPVVLGLMREVDEETLRCP
jgi:hypothetical protein